MPLVTNVSNSVDGNLREQLDSNFKELDKSRININGYEFNSTADRMDYIESVIKQLGMPIDPKEEKEMYGG
ncbi:hypothetical protein [Weissella paramesenteroides]|uniref:hypothetical protein n=1 Tax=Weissella paramesenteroides TaxID=1249 RepID=UPI00123B421A|nr:hypothetical protein [Weissella paramesenteroides]KAA8446929.1 hypothetical protein FKV72_03815 [Weissella paramesenteroides]KAA8450565.1 hypothetical protein FKV71_08505 [Weissella paramesenteroides]